jgi:peptidoglycan/xylan/chitin deacetylase (PgdA/CDA1 family)
MERTLRLAPQGAVLRRSASAAAPAFAPPIVHDVLRGGGRPLDGGVRARMEPRFQHSFADVRVHADGRAAESARAVGAQAYAVGRDVVFGAGRYAPGSAEGDRLIAHELAHVVQGRGAPSSLQPKLEIGAADDAAEREADAAAGVVLAGGTAALGGGGGGTLRRLPEGDEEGGLLSGLMDTVSGAVSGAVDAVSGVVTSAVDAASAAVDALTGAAAATRTFSLTFDDGPHTSELGKGTNRTEKVLDVLKSNGIKGAFFIQTGATHRGNNPIGRALVKRMQAEGHKVGIHTGGTADHELHPAAAKDGRLEGELNAAKSYVKAETGEDATLVRPPTGALNSAVTDIYSKTGLTNMLWDMDGDQGRSLGLRDLKARIESEMKKVVARGWKPTTPSPNVVVLYHDIQKGTADNLPALITHIKDTTSALSGGKDTAAFAPP